MIPDQATFEHGMKIAVSLFLFGIGCVAFARPGDFFGVTPYFERAAGELSPLDRQRLRCTLAARERARDVSGNYGRWLGAVCMAAALFALAPGVPYAAPYALVCLVLAWLMLQSYLQSRRATERRVAPLLRRSFLSVVPLSMVIALGCCFAATTALAASPQLRVGAVAAALTTLAMAAIAWRIAAAPAVLPGIDPQAEYAVDERLRLVRAAGVGILGCVVASLLLQTLIPSNIAEHSSLSAVQQVVRLVAIYATIPAMLQYNFMLRKPIQIA
jgi:hypothetical protein